MIKVMRLKRTGNKKKGFLIYFVFLVFFLPATQAWSAAEWSEYSRDLEGNVYSYKINNSRGKHIVQAGAKKKLVAVDLLISLEDRLPGNEGFHELPFSSPQEEA